MRVGMLVMAASLAPLGCKASAVPRTFDNHVSAAPSGQLPQGRSAVIPGERFSYKMTMLGFDAGVLDMAAGQPGEVDGKQVVFMRSRASSRGVVAMLKTVTDDVTVHIDLASGTPLYHHTVSKVGDSDEAVEIKYAPGQFDVAETIGGKRTVETQIVPDGGPAYDLTSSLMAMRGWQARPGDRVELMVLRSTMFWKTTVQYQGPDSAKIGLGRFPAVRIDGVSRRVLRSGALEDGKEARHFSIWLSDDERRVPLLIAAKTDLGDIKMELVEYESPDGTLIAAQ
jgi:hypothetical protein